MCCRYCSSSCPEPPSAHSRCWWRTSWVPNRSYKSPGWAETSLKLNLHQQGKLWQLIVDLFLSHRGYCGSRVSEGFATQELAAYKLYETYPKQTLDFLLCFYFSLNGCCFRCCTVAGSAGSYTQKGCHNCFMINLGLISVLDMLTFFISTLLQKSFAGGYLILWRLLAGSTNRFSRPEAADVYLDKQDTASPAEYMEPWMSWSKTHSISEPFLWIMKSGGAKPKKNWA